MGDEGGEVAGRDVDDVCAAVSEAYALGGEGGRGEDGGLVDDFGYFADGDGLAVEDAASDVEFVAADGVVGVEEDVDHHQDADSDEYDVDEEHPCGFVAEVYGANEGYHADADGPGEPFVDF